MRGNAEHMLLPTGRALDAPDHPLQYAHVLREARPDKTATVIGAEPVDTINLRQPRTGRLEAFAERKPVGEIVPMW